MALFLGTDVINKKSQQDNLASCFYNQEKEFTWLKKSDTGEDMAHCKLCNTNFSVTAGALF